MDAIVRKLESFLQGQVGLTRGEAVLVACSGGADSLALLVSMDMLSKKLGFRLGCAHFEHGLRGSASIADMEFVRLTATRLGIPFFQASTKILLGHDGNLEAMARRERYGFLQAIARDAGYDWIAVGHTADDQVETIAYKFFRGASMASLAGMPALRGRIMRPLLGCRRSEIEAFLRAQGYAWREDLTNQDSRYRRNALRKTILPLIESVFPDLRARILELGEEADRENRDLPHHQQAYSLAARDEVGGGISWDWDALSRAPVSVALRLIAARLARQAEAGHLPRRGVYRSLETRLASRSNVGGTLYQGRAGILMLNRSRLYCYPPLPPEFSQATKRQYSLKVGEFVFPWGRILVSEDDLPAAVDRNFFQEQAERAIFWVSMGVMQRDSILRMARPGDAIHCDGKRRQSVAELLSANGVPKPWRASALVLDGGDGCDALFVPAMLTKSRHGCTALVTADMRRALRLFFDRHETDTKDR